jgi:SAM-dependent methyltransferase
LRFSSNFLRRYLDIAPAAMAMERAIECEVQARNSWPSPILDIGCGDGFFARILCEDKIDTGIDPQSSEIERARESGAYHELIVCYGDKIPRPDGSYNTIVSNSVLEHIPDLVPVLKEANRLLAPEGRFYITIPSDRLERATAVARVLSAVGLSSLAAYYGKFYNRFWRHYHAYDDAGWRKLFDQADLEVIEHFAYVPRDLSTCYDLLTVAALPGFVAKKAFDRWILLPWLRPLYAGAIERALKACIRGLNSGDGTLLFYALKKRMP